MNSYWHPCEEVEQKYDVCGTGHEEATQQPAPTFEPVDFGVDGILADLPTNKASLRDIEERPCTARFEHRRRSTFRRYVYFKLSEF